jgi:hypothetical protein
LPYCPRGRIGQHCLNVSIPDPEPQNGLAAAPPPLSDAYHEARKNYALVSGLLLACELLDIEPQGATNGDEVSAKVIGEIGANREAE